MRATGPCLSPRAEKAAATVRTSVSDTTPDLAKSAAKRNGKKKRSAKRIPAGHTNSMLDELLETKPSPSTDRKITEIRIRARTVQNHELTLIAEFRERPDSNEWGGRTGTAMDETRNPREPARLAVKNRERNSTTYPCIAST
jgi:hypothetical protein